MAQFDVNDNVRKVTATANGNLVDFDFNFQVNATTDIDVALDGVAKQLTSDYTIVTSAGAAGLNADGTGTVRFNSAPANNVTVSIKSATGCSIDSSVRFIQTIESKFNIVLLDKMNVTYRVNNNIDYTQLKNFISMAKKKLIHEDVIVFNNLVVNKKEYRTQWEVPASSSWHSRYFKK